MHTIQIDDEIFGLLEKNAKAFVDSPNSTLRRLLGLETSRPLTAKEPKADYELDELLRESMAARRIKAPKANLKTLVEAGLLVEGEPLHLVDYQGKRIGHFKAVVAGGFLQFNGRHYTMSNLATELLKKVGFQSDSVRGPSHWVNANDISVTDLWQQLLDKTTKK